MKYPADAAYEAITGVMALGSAKDGCNESWREKDIRMHLLKMIRHATTALLVLDGHVTDAESFEEHVERAVTRGSMVLAEDHRD